MARSRKKTPGWCDSNPWAKRLANRRVRRYKDPIPNGGGYQKLYESWSICDWRMLCFSVAEARRRWPDKPWKAWSK